MNTSAVHRFKNNVTHISERPNTSQPAKLSYATDGNNCLDTRVVDTPQTVLQSVLREPVRVNVQLFNSKIIYGKLISIDYGKNQFLIHESIRENHSEIDFSDVRYMNFPDAELPQNYDPANEQGFRFIFIDNASFCGTAKAIHEDFDGVHIWQSKFDSGIKHVFIPSQAIRNNYSNSQIGKKLIQEKVISESQLSSALDHQQNLREKRVGEYLREIFKIDALHIDSALARQANTSGQVIGEILLADKLITEQQLIDALELQKSDRSKRLGQVITELGLASAAQVQSALAQNFGLPFLKLRNLPVSGKSAEQVSFEFATKHTLAPIMENGNRLMVAIEDPTNTQAISMLQLLTGKELEIAVATGDDIREFLDKMYTQSADKNVVLPDSDDATIDSDLSTEEQAAYRSNHPAIKFILGMVKSALSRGASEIHFRPHTNNAEILLRVDSELIKSNRISKSLVRAVSYRLKIMAGLKSKEFQLSQSGTAQIALENQFINIRISCFPAEHGECIDIKILKDTDIDADRKLDEIGFSTTDLHLLKKMLSSKSGMLIVAGPPGSGKSTTLYSTLEKLGGNNISVKSIESHVSRNLPGVQQLEVNPANGLSYQEAMQQVLKLDSDVIMVDRLHDREATHLALQSANCGHLILSTVEANNTATAVVRLLEMEMEPDMVASSLIGVISQRLVRRNCPHCLAEEKVDPEIREKLRISEDEVFYKGQGCKECGNSGYKGHMPVYEILPVTQQQRSMLAPGISGYDIYEQGIEDGMTPLLNKAIEEARDRKTSLEEVYRIRMQ